MTKKKIHFRKYLPVVLFVVILSASVYIATQLSTKLGISPNAPESKPAAASISTTCQCYKQCPEGSKGTEQRCGTDGTWHCCVGSSATGGQQKCSGKGTKTASVCQNVVIGSIVTCGDNKCICKVTSSGNVCSANIYSIDSTPTPTVTESQDQKITCPGSCISDRYYHCNATPQSATPVKYNCPYGSTCCSGSSTRICGRFGDTGKCYPGNYVCSKGTSALYCANGQICGYGTCAVPTPSIETCTPLKTRCRDNYLQTCNNKGVWETAASPCPHVCSTLTGVAKCE